MPMVFISHDMFGAELQVTEKDDEEENLDEYLSQLDLNTSFNEYCLNDVMTRIESSHSSSLSSAASLWEDDVRTPRLYKIIFFAVVRDH